MSDPTEGRPRSGLGQVVAVTAACFMAVIVLSGVVLTALGEEGPQLSLPGLLGSVAVVSATLAGAGLALGAGGPGVVARLRLVPASPLDAVVAGLGTLALGAALDAVVFLLGLRDEGTLGMMHALLGRQEGVAKVGAALLVGLAPGLGEELFFRGYVLRKLAFTDGAAVGVAVSAALFGLFHADPVQSPAAAVVGLYLGFMVLRTGSLWVGIAAHTLNNVGATFLAGHTPTVSSAVATMALGAICAASAARFVARRHGAALPPATPW